ncbi:MAG: hypothetical protein JWQ11_2751 [Rhizobacter sp.]|nr:hypothetical protein [Rhizobacter sp.]
MSADPPVAVNPLAAFQNFVRLHLSVVNGVLLSASTLVAVLDFLAPRLSAAPIVIYSCTAAITLALIAAGVVPRAFARLLSAIGMQAQRSDLIPLWRRPAWQFAVAMLATISIVGYASVAKARQGGLIASSIPAARSYQETLLSLRSDTADIKQGVAAVNGRLDVLIADSHEPQKDLVARGYKYTSGGLMTAIKQGDSRAVGLFVQAGLRVDSEGVLLVLVSGEQPWNQQIADMLPRSMFESKEACKAGGNFAYEVKSPLEARVALFKRLCDPTSAIASIQRAEQHDAGRAPENDWQARQRAARTVNLGLLKS